MTLAKTFSLLLDFDDKLIFNEVQLLDQENSKSSSSKDKNTNIQYPKPIASIKLKQI